jgi:hypothetical protein
MTLHYITDILVVEAWGKSSLKETEQSGGVPSLPSMVLY